MSVSFVRGKPNQILKNRLLQIERSSIEINTILNKQGSNIQIFLTSKLLKATDESSKTDAFQCLILAHILAIQKCSLFSVELITGVFDSLVNPIIENNVFSFQIFNYFFDNLDDFKSEFTKTLLSVFIHHFESLRKVGSFEAILFKILRNINHSLLTGHSIEFALQIIDLFSSKTDFLVRNCTRDLNSCVFFQFIKALQFCYQKPQFTATSNQILVLIRVFLSSLPAEEYLLNRETYSIISSLLKMSDFAKDFDSINLNELLETKSHQTAHVQVITSSIPVRVENYLIFILSSATRSSFNQHLNWLLNMSNVQSGEESELLIVDLIRYVLICTKDMYEEKDQNRIRRWLIIGWLFNAIKFEKVRLLAKRSIFIDWIADLKYLEEEQTELEIKRNLLAEEVPMTEIDLLVASKMNRFRIVFTGWELILNSFKNYPQLSNEFLEFAINLTQERSPSDDFGRNLYMIKMTNSALFRQMENSGYLNQKNLIKINEIFADFAQVMSLTESRKFPGKNINEFSQEKIEIIDQNSQMIFEKVSTENAYQNDQIIEKNFVSVSTNFLNDSSENFMDQTDGKSEYDSILTTISDIFSKIDQKLIKNKNKLAYFLQNQHRVFIEKLVSKVGEENSLEAQTNYCENGFFIFKNLSLMYESPSLTHELLKKASILFNSDLLAYSFLETAISFLMSSCHPFMLEVIVICYQAKGKKKEQVWDLMEIIARSMNQTPSISTAIEELFKWSFVHCDEKEFASFYLFVDELLKKIGSESVVYQWAGLFLNFIDERNFGCLISPDFIKPILRCVTSYLAEVLNQNVSKNLLVNAISIISACFFNRVEFDKLGHKCLFWKIKEISVVGSLMQYELNKLCFLAVNFYEEVV